MSSFSEGMHFTVLMGASWTLPFTLGSFFVALSWKATEPSKSAEITPILLSTPITSQRAATQSCTGDSFICWNSRKATKYSIWTVCSQLMSYLTKCDLSFPLSSLPLTRKSKVTLSRLCWSTLCSRSSFTIWVHWEVPCWDSPLRVRCWCRSAVPLPFGTLPSECGKRRSLTVEFCWKFIRCSPRCSLFRCFRETFPMLKLIITLL